MKEKAEKKDLKVETLMLTWSVASDWLIGLLVGWTILTQWSGQGR